MAPNLISVASFVFIALCQTLCMASTIKPTTYYNEINTGNSQQTPHQEDHLDVMLEGGEGEATVTTSSNDPTFAKDNQQEVNSFTTDPLTFNAPTSSIEADFSHDPFPSDPEGPECLYPNGTFPNWHDDTCTSFLVCRDFVPTMQACPDGEVFSALERDCVTTTIFSCDVTNEAIRVASDAFSLLQGYIGVNSEGRVKRSSDKLASANGKDNDDMFEIVLPSSICELISWNTDFFETNMNNLIRINTSCLKGSSCKVPRMFFRCESQAEDESDSGDDY